MAARGAGCVAALARAAGGEFISQRFSREAWPALRELLERGRTSSGIGGDGYAGLLTGRMKRRSAQQQKTWLLLGSNLSSSAAEENGGEDENDFKTENLTSSPSAVAPGSLRTVRLAVLRSLTSIAADPRSAACLSGGGVAFEVAESVIPLASDAATADVRHAAISLLRALAASPGVEGGGDAVWLALAEAEAFGGGGGGGSGGGGESGKSSSSSSCSPLLSRQPPPGFPPVATVLPPPLKRRALLPAGCSLRAAVLLREVEKEEKGAGVVASWWEKVKLELA